MGAQGLERIKIKWFDENPAGPPGWAEALRNAARRVAVQRLSIPLYFLEKAGVTLEVELDLAGLHEARRLAWIDLCSALTDATEEDICAAAAEINTPCGLYDLYTLLASGRARIVNGKLVREKR